MRKIDRNVSDYLLTEPHSEVDWQRYYDLRWRILRAPWNQPRDSERDDRENDSFHVMLCRPDRIPVAIGRLHFLSATEAQVRFMAVEPESVGRGLGSRILLELERRAATSGAQRIVLNARKKAVPFYLKHGYSVIGPAETLFGAIEHSKMEKRSRSPFLRACWRHKHLNSRC